MKPLLALAALLMAAALLTGCSTSPPRDENGVGYWHDDVRHVSCWTFGAGGSYAASISCLPDRWVNP